MRLPPDFDLIMTPYEFQLYQEGYQKAQLAEWERTRFVAWMVQATQTSEPLTIQQVLPLPSDQPETTTAPSATSRIKLDEKTQQRINALFEKKSNG